MTIASATNKSGPYFYNGSATSFAYGFKISNEAHIRVVETVTATGVETDLVLNTDYTVTGVDADAGGNVVISPARAAGKSVVMVRNTPFTQGVVLENQGAYFAKVVEGAFDDAAARDQQLQEQISRAVVVPVSADATDLETLIGGVVSLLDNVDAVVTVAGISGAVTTVAANAAAVSTVATNVAAVVIAASNIATIIAVPALATQVAADRVVVAADKATVAADKATVATNTTTTNTNAGLTAADKVATAADRVQTGLDRIQTAADRVQTGLDRIAAAASAASVVAADIVHYTVETNSAARQSQARANIGAIWRGPVIGFVLSNNATDAVNDIDLTPGDSPSDNSSPAIIKLSSTLIKRLDAAWGVGSNQGGLDTGAKANNTWYYEWAILRSDTGVVDALFSLSPTAPTMPTSYDHKVLLGAFKTDGAGAIRAFKHTQGNRFEYVTRVTDVSASSSGTSAVSRVLTAPPNSLALVDLQVAAAEYINVLPSDLSASVPDSAAGCTLSTSARGGAQVEVRVGATSAVNTIQNGGTAQIIMSTTGFLFTQRGGF